MNDELDELKAAWAGHSAALQRSLVIDERLLQDLFVRKARAAMLPHIAWRVIELICGVAFVLATAPVVFAHAADLRYLVLGGTTVALAVAMTAWTAMLVVRGARLDADAPVANLQQEILRLQSAEYRVFTWALLGGVAAWLPALLLVLEAATGVEAIARVDGPWLVANWALGLVALGLGRVWSRRYVERADRSPWAGRLIESLSGRGLQRAGARLRELETFVSSK